MVGTGLRAELLKDRAGFFLRLGRELLQRGRLDIAAFCVEQAMQLRVKAALLRVAGEAPRIHGIRELLGLLAQLLDELGRGEAVRLVREYVRRYRGELVDAEDAYTAARYAVYTPDRGSVERMIKAAERLFEVLEEVERDVLG